MPHISDLLSVARVLAPDGDAPLTPSDIRLRELMHAHAKGYEVIFRSDLEIQMLYVAGVVFGLFFLAWGIWAHYGDKALRAKWRQRQRMSMKRRSKRPKRKRT